MTNDREMIRLSLRMLGNSMSKNTAFTVKDWWMRITGVQQAAIWIGATSPDLDLIGDVAYKLYYEAD